MGGRLICKCTEFKNLQEFYRLSTKKKWGIFQNFTRFLQKCYSQKNNEVFSKVLQKFFQTFYRIFSKENLREFHKKIINIVTEQVQTSYSFQKSTKISQNIYRKNISLGSINDLGSMWKDLEYVVFQLYTYVHRSSSNFGR